MRGETTSVVRGFERTLAMLATFTLLMAVMIIYAEPALAHHPILDGSATCNTDGDIEVTWSLSNGNWSGRSMTLDQVEYTDGEDLLEDIQVGLVLVADESVEDTVVYPGGETGVKTLRVRADWDYGSEDVSGEYSIDLGQYDCQPEAQPVTVVVGHGSCDGSTRLGWAFVAIDPDAGATVTLEGPGGPYVASSSTSLELDPGSYTWSADPAQGFALEGDEYGSFDIVPCDATVVVGHGDCSVDGSMEPGFVTVSIEPEGGAVVTVHGPTGSHTFDGGGGSQMLEGGDYTWEAAGSGNFELTGETSGEFTVEDCGELIVKKEVVGTYDGDDVFRISVAAGDTAIWTDDLGDGDSSGTIPVNPGTYVAGEDVPDGWDLSDLVCDDDGASRGDGPFMTIDVEPGETITCTFYNEKVVVVEDDDVDDEVVDDQVDDEVIDEVEDESVEAEDDTEVLPFTGVDTGALMGISAALMAAGMTLVHHARRREEDEV